jgi:glycosyltransferase involved in cell wall biosynthesis
VTNGQTLSLVLPAHNEEDNLEWIVREALATLPRYFRAHEIIVVNDGSGDATSVIADQLAAEYPQVRVLHQARQQGYGAALRAGFAVARGDLLLFMDANRQFDIREVAKFIPWSARAAIVTGYRLQRCCPWPQRALDATATLLARVLFGVRARDITCGYTLVRTDLLRALDLRSAGRAINAELLAQARRCNAVIVEVGVWHYPRPTGTQVGHGLRALRHAPTEAARLWWRLHVTTAALQRQVGPR